MSKYQEIVEYLKTIALKRLDGKPLPSVRALMKKFHVSQAPVSRAIAELKAQGIVRTRRGAGTMSNLGNPGMVQMLQPVGEDAVSTEKGTILSFYCDYPSLTIWRFNNTLRMCCIQQHIRLEEYRLWQDTNLVEALHNLLSAKRYTGIVLFDSGLRLTGRLCKVLRDARIPVVVLDNLFEYKHLPRRVSLLSPDGAQWARLAAQTFHERGMKHVGIVRNEPLVDLEVTRREEFQAACRAYGMTCHVFSSSIRFWESSAEAARRIITQSLDEIRRDGVEGLVFSSTEGAIGAAQQLQMAGMRIPQDISILGGTGNAQASYTYPAISMMDYDVLSMIQTAIDLIVGRMKYTREIKYSYTLTDLASLRPRR